MDIVLTKGTTQGLVECKFYMRPGTRCNVETSLSLFARLEDIYRHKGTSFHRTDTHEGWLVINTRFTDDALAYGSCAGLKLLGWNTGPLGESLERLIDRHDLHPITCLTSLKKEHKQTLLTNDIVLCQDLLDGKINIQTLLSTEITKNAITEANELCKHRDLVS